MNDPQRWLDDPGTSSDLRQILESAEAPPALPEALNARLSEYAITLASQSVLAKVGGTSVLAKLLSSSASVKTGVALASVLAVAGAGTALLRPTHDAPSLATTSHVIPAVPSPSTPSLAAKSDAAVLPSAPPAPSLAETPVAVESPTHGKTPLSAGTPPIAGTLLHETASAVPPASASPAASSIAAEAKLLETARSFLDDSPALSLQLTERDQTTNPGGQLSAERELIAIEALLRLGRRQEAERRAAPRLERAPDSLYARRLRQLLNVAPATPNTKKQ
jgi:hypothetical protein